MVDQTTALAARFESILARLPPLEAALDAKEALALRQLRILARLQALSIAASFVGPLLILRPGVDHTPLGSCASENHQDGTLLKMQCLRLAHDSAAAARTAGAAASEARAAAPAIGVQVTAGASDTQRHLEAELAQLSFSNARFVRCPSDYYEHSLEFRMNCVQAASIHHLCKSMIMVNTRVHPSADGWSDPHNSQYYTVVVQYTARLNAEKLATYVSRILNKQKFGKQYFNFRLAPGPVSDELSGFSHNAVTPVGCRTRLPIILSHKIAQLQPAFFFLGGGEVDLKLGLPVDEFVRAYKPFIADCTYDDGTADSP